jgi:SAM-dependent methyltransferase
VSTPRWHGDFYTAAFQGWSESLQAAAEARPINALITGLADYGMLYWLAQSLEHGFRSRCTFRVLDICPTPIASCVWLQRRLMRLQPGLRLNVVAVHRNVFNNGLDPGSFDLVTSDAFLTRFSSADEKRALLAEWLRLLRPGGSLITTARVRESADDITATDRQRFVQRAVNASGDAAGLEGQIEAIARNYADYIESFPFMTESCLSALVREAAADAARCEIDFRLIDDYEMTRANYARIVVER